jgi:two-component system, cell cycle response regulator DivK
MTRLLVIEDNEMNRDMLSRRLTRRGYEVLVACDGVEGIEAARNHLPDLILMDLSLPEMDGWTATQILKSDSNTRHIPVIVLTAHAMESGRQKAFSAGCDAFDTKPVEIARLTEIMTRLLQERTNHADHPSG